VSQPKSIDNVARMKGSVDALKDVGLKDELKNHERNRLGAKVPDAPNLRAQPQGQYTRSGTLKPGKLAAFEEEQALNYGKATTPATSCKTCVYYDEIDATIGTCRKYDFTAEQDKTCDSWKSSHFVRSHLR
jgi:hypothetical protein